MSLVIEANERQTNSVVMSNSILRSSPDFDNLIIMPDVWVSSGWYYDIWTVPTIFSVNWTAVNFSSFSVSQWRSEMPIWWLTHWWKWSFVWHNYVGATTFSQNFNCVISTPLQWWEIIWKKIIYRLIYWNLASSSQSYANMTMRIFLLHTDWTKTYIWNSVQLGATSTYTDLKVLLWEQQENTNGVIASAGDYVWCDFTYFSSHSWTSARTCGIWFWSSGWSAIGASASWSTNFYWYPCPIEISIE